MIRVRDLQEEATIVRRRQVEEDAVAAHRLKLLIGYIVAVLDGIGA